MSTYRNTYGEFPDGEKLRLVQSETGEVVDISRLEPDEAYRTLGAWIAANGGQKKQLKVLAAKVDLWIHCITNSSLSRQDKQITYTAFLKPQIVYPLGCASIEPRDLKRLYRPVSDVLLHTLGLNKHFPQRAKHYTKDKAFQFHRYGRRVPYFATK